MQKKRVVGYVKISKSDTLDSVQRHREKFETVVARHSDWELVDIYAEHVKTRNDKWVAYDQLIKDAEAHKFDYIIVMSVSRISYEPLVVLEEVEKFVKLGLGVYFVQEDLFIQNDNDVALQRFDILATYLESAAKLRIHVGNEERAVADKEYEESTDDDE